MAMTIAQHLSAMRARLATIEAHERTEQEIIQTIADACRSAGGRDPSQREADQANTAIRARGQFRSDAAALRLEIVNMEREQADDERIDAAQRIITPVGGATTGQRDGDYGQGTRQLGTSGPRWTRQDGRPAAVERGQRFTDHEIVQEFAARRATAERPVIEGHGSLGNLIRSMTTVSGSAIVPTIWSGDIITRARNYAAVLQAGAEIIPMDSKIMQIGRLTGDPTAGFRNESSLVASSDPSFDAVTLSANTLSCLVVGSLEWFQDAIDVENVVTEAISKAVALELDLNALYGGVVAGSEIGATGFNRTLTAPPSPRGVLAALLAQAPGNVLGGATNGTTQTPATPWKEIIDTLYTPADSNEVVNGMIWSSRMARKYAQLVDTLSQPLRTPDAVQAIPRYVSNQLPSSMTVGTAVTSMSDVFAGDWTQLLIGQRLEFQIQTLVERYAELGQVGILATWRGDIQPARPKAFSVYRYLSNV